MFSPCLGFVGLSLLWNDQSTVLPFVPGRAVRAMRTLLSRKSLSSPHHKTCPHHKTLAPPSFLFYPRRHTPPPPSTARPAGTLAHCGPRPLSSSMLLMQARPALRQLQLQRPRNQRRPPRRLRSQPRSVNSTHMAVPYITFFNSLIFLLVWPSWHDRPRLRLSRLSGQTWRWAPNSGRYRCPRKRLPVPRSVEAPTWLLASLVFTFRPSSHPYQ